MSLFPWLKLHFYAKAKYSTLIFKNPERKIILLKKKKKNSLKLHIIRMERILQNKFVLIMKKQILAIKDKLSVYMSVYMF